MTYIKGYRLVSTYRYRFTNTFICTNKEMNV